MRAYSYFHHNLHVRVRAKSQCLQSGWRISRARKKIVFFLDWILDSQRPSQADRLATSGLLSGRAASRARAARQSRLALNVVWESIVGCLCQERVHGNDVFRLLRYVNMFFMMVRTTCVCLEPVHTIKNVLDTWLGILQKREGNVFKGWPASSDRLHKASRGLFRGSLQGLVRG